VGELNEVHNGVRELNDSASISDGVICLIQIIIIAISFILFYFVLFYCNIESFPCNSGVSCTCLVIFFPLLPVRICL